MSDESLSAVVVAEIENWPEAATVTVKSLFHLGNRAAVDQAWSRLARAGQLLRIGRGRYVRPVRTRFGVRTPDLSEVFGAIQKETGEVIAPSGAASANQLGLAARVPVTPA
jgi:predicted transcriptional regulator of viral defense system